MENRKIYHTLEGFVKHIRENLGDAMTCVINYKQRTSRDAEGIDYTFEALCIPLDIVLRTGCRVSHDDKGQDDGKFLQELKREIMVTQKGLLDRITFNHQIY